MRRFDTVLDTILESLDSKLAFITKIVVKDLSGPKSRLRRLAERENISGVSYDPGEGDQDQGFVEKVAHYFNQYDPTKSEAVYTTWILNAYIRSNLDLPEDGMRIVNALAKFIKAKKQRGWAGEKDINKYPDLNSLEQAVKDVSLEVDSPATFRGWDKYVKDKIRDTVVKIYGDDLFSMYKIQLTGEEYDSVLVKRLEEDKYSYGEWVPKTVASGQNVKIIQSNTIDIASYCIAMITKNKTSYCVANPLTANNYLKKGPLFLANKVIDGKTTPFFLADAQWNELLSPGIGGSDQLPLTYPMPNTMVFLLKLLLGEDSSQHLTPGAKSWIKTKLSNRLDYVKNQMKPGKMRDVLLNKIIEITQG